MLCVAGLTRGLGLAAVNTVSREATSRPARAIVLADGKKTPFNLNTHIDPLDAGDLRFGGARVRGLRHTGRAATRVGRLFWHWLLPYPNALENVICVHPARTRSGILDHLGARPQRRQSVRGGEGGARCRMRLC
jgi:ABC-type branched-subunit amino acid transport system ATPase component